MNVLLSHAYFLEEDPKEKRIMKPYPPLGILSVAAWLEKHEVPCEVLDSTFLSRSEWQSKVQQIKPSVLAMYANLVTKVTLLELIEWVDSNIPEVTIILGGPDVTYNVENYLNAGIDFCVIGEGEVTMLALVQAIRGQPTNFTQIDGLAFKLEDGSIFKTQPRAKLKVLDELPAPARDKIDLSLYLNVWKQHHGHRSISISTQRGCPYTCRWCSTAVYGQSYRRRSPKHVVEEIRALRNSYEVHRLWFVDDVFTVSHQWLNAFEKALQEENVQIEFECITRADRLNHEVLDTLARMGCFRVWIGAESGSQRILDLMDRRVKKEKVRDMILAARAKGMEAGTFIMLGYPGETERDVKETLAHLKQSSPDHFTITVSYPIKGTKLYEEVEEKLITPGPWPQTTDRDLEYPRTYPRKYYHHAVRWITNSVKLNEQLKNQFEWRAATKYLIKVTLSRMAMSWHRIIGN